MSHQSDNECDNWERVGYGAAIIENKKVLSILKLVRCSLQSLLELFLL